MRQRKKVRVIPQPTSVLTGRGNIIDVPNAVIEPDPQPYVHHVDQQPNIPQNDCSDHPANVFQYDDDSDDDEIVGAVCVDIVLNDVSFPSTVSNMNSFDPRRSLSFLGRQQELFMAVFVFVSRRRILPVRGLGCCCSTTSTDCVDGDSVL